MWNNAAFQPSDPNYITPPIPSAIPTIQTTPRSEPAYERPAARPVCSSGASGTKALGVADGDEVAFEADVPSVDAAFEHAFGRDDAGGVGTVDGGVLSVRSVGRKSVVREVPKVGAREGSKRGMV